VTVRGLMTSLGAKGLQTRWLVRSPIWAYRAGLGLVFGSRLLMLEHRGRVSGLSRYVVLEVVDHPSRDQCRALPEPAVAGPHPRS
jgi:hypothetical protein